MWRLIFQKSTETGLALPDTQFHIIPEHDEKEHWCTSECWCNPKNDDGIYSHHDKLDREVVSL